MLIMKNFFSMNNLSKEYSDMKETIKILRKSIQIICVRD